MSTPEHTSALSGVFAPVVTPFEDDKLRLDYLRSNLVTLGRSSLSGYLALGSNGEFRSLTDVEQNKVLDVFADQKGDKIVMAGASAESTVDAVRRANHAASLGFEYASILPPSYFAKAVNDDVIKRFYTAVADESKIPVVMYNAPQFTGGVQISTRVVAELAKHPNIAGLKDSSKPGPGAILAELAPDSGFAVLAGSTNFFYPSLVLGATGGILSLANAIPEACVELYRLIRSNDSAAAIRRHRDLVRLNQAVSGAYGVAGVKAAVTIAGMQGGTPRSPLVGLSKKESAALERILRDAKVL